MKYLVPLLTLMMCCIKCVAQTYIEPVFDRTDEPSLHINKIEVTKDTTFVHCTYTAMAGSWARISKDTYLYDCDKHKKYTILRCSGLPFTPQQRDFRFEETVQIYFCFPNIGNATRLDFIEDPNDEAFNIYGINLKEHYEASYKATDLDHFSKMSSIFENSGNDSAAIQYKKKELEASKYLYGVKSEIYVLSLSELGTIYYKYGDYTRAIEVMTMASKVHGKADELYAQQLYGIALVYSHAQDYEKSIKYYMESIELYESLNIADNIYALALELLANNYEAIGDEEQTICYRLKSLDAWRNIGDSDKYINELYNIALTVTEDKDVDKTRIQCVEKELSSLPDFVDTASISFVDIYEKMAFSYTLHEYFDCAILYCDKALTLLPVIGMDHSEKYAEVLSEKSRYQKQAHQTYEAIITGEKSKQIFEALQIKSTNYAWLLSDLADCYSDIYDYEKAIQLQELACDIYEETSEWLSLAEALNYIGIYYRNRYDFGKAEMYIQRGLDILSNNVTAEKYVGDDGTERLRQQSYSVFQDRIQRMKSSYCHELANIYSEAGEKEKAIEAGMNAVQILKEMPNDEDLYISSLCFLSILYKNNECFEEAIAIEEQCLEYWKNRDRKDEIARSQANMAIAYFEKGDTLQAIEYAKKSVSTFRKIDNIIELAAGLGTLAIFYWNASKYVEAERCLSEALDYLRMMIQQNITEMTSEQKQRLWNKYRNLFFLYRDIVYKGRMDGEKISKLYDYVLFSKSLLLDSETFSENLLSKRLNVTWEDIQKKLFNEDIAVEFIATQEEVTERMTYFVYHALVIDKNCRYPKMVTLIHDKGVENDIEHVSQLWNPILDQYKEVKNIYFSPDGVMHGLPIENLYVDNIGFLSDKYNMYRLSSTKELVKPYKELKIKDAVLYGGLSYSIGDVPDLAMVEGEQANLLRGIKERGGFDPLYSTSTEIYNISRLLEQNDIRTTLYMNENGTEDSFRELSGASIDLIHLATHGMFVENENVIQRKEENNFTFMESLDNEKNPVYENTLLTHSFLVMAGGNKMPQRETAIEKSNDGILTAQEISELDLSGIDLVVLSACETAKGDLTMDGILGLPWGFKKAGANTILMSLNEVDDEATTLLMIEFYKNLMSGESKLQSLKDAQKYLRKYDNGKYDKPEYWASFIMLDGLD